MSNTGISGLLKRYISLVFLVIGFIGFLFIWFVFPKSSLIVGVYGVVQLLTKLITFIVICLGVCLFPNKSKYRYLLLLVPVVFFLGYIIPRLSYYGFFGAAAGSNDIAREGYYVFLYLICFPSILLSVAFAFRLGGGLPGDVIKITLSGVLVLFSGFLDLMWFVVNPVPFPETLKYAHHIKMILGHYPKYSEAIIFAFCHLPVLLLLLFLPLNKWFDKILPQS